MNVIKNKKKRRMYDHMKDETTCNFLLIGRKVTRIFGADIPTHSSQIFSSAWLLGLNPFEIDLTQV